MHVSLSIVKADIGSIAGNICPSQYLVQTVREFTTEHGAKLLLDSYVSYTGDDIAIVSTHERRPRRCAARNLSRAGVPESVAMEITGHKTRSMYRRYRIVDERDLREATEKLQSHLEGQSKEPSVVPMKAAQG